MIRTAFSLILCFVLAGVGRGHSAQDPLQQSKPAPVTGDAVRAALLDGVANIASPGNPGPICVFGPNAFPVVLAHVDGDARAPVVAAGQRGAGRIVVFGHGGFFGSTDTADTGRLLLNAARFVARSGAAKPRVANVSGGAKLAEYLQKAGLQMEAFTGARTAEALREFDLLVYDQSDASPAEIAAVGQFVDDGGGLLASGLVWGWLQTHPGKIVSQYGMNDLLAPAGLVLADGTVGPRRGKSIQIEQAEWDLYHAARALEALIEPTPKVAEKADSKPTITNAARAKKPDSRMATAARTLTDAARAIPAGDLLLRPRIVEIVKSRAAGMLPSPERPLRAADALDRALLAFEIANLENAPDANVVAHPAAAAFPGVVAASGKPLTRAIEIPTQATGWHSTGLYAPAGAKIQLKVDSGDLPAGTRLQTGCHTDSIWHLGEWRRVPEIVKSVTVVNGVATVTSPFGGLVYVDIPRRGANGGETVKITISGAVDSPRFILGRTDGPAFLEAVATTAAPWVELETSKIILSVPVAAVAKVKDPATLMQWWDRIADGAADLYGRPAERKTPERFVADVQISAGYMHSGYPIMMHLDGADHVTDLDLLKSDRAWGVYHELGHNHQEGDWTFEGTGEVTNNIFTVYAIGEIARADVTGGDRSPAKRAERFADYDKKGRKFEVWKSEPFLALDMYLQIKDAFGWDVYKKIFKEYRTLPRAERPKNDADKRDQWMVRLSRHVNKNLGPFFDAWGVPVTEKAKNSIKDLPVWMPEGLGYAKSGGRGGK